MFADIMEKAGELAEAIAESCELSTVKEAEMAMHNDPEAVNIISKFQEKQKVIYNSQMCGQELSDEDKKEIAEIEEMMKGNTAIRTYIDASEKFEHLMRSVNMVITRAISGNQGCECGPECGPDCGSSCGMS